MVSENQMVGTFQTVWTETYTAQRAGTVPEFVLKNTTRGLLGKLGIGLLLVVIPATIAESIRLLVQGPASSGVLAAQPFSPGIALTFDSLTFILGWMLYVTGAAFVRSRFMRFLGDAGSFTRVFQIAWVGAWPLILIAGLHRLLNGIVPFASFQDAPAVTYVRLVVYAILFGLAWILEARYAVKQHQTLGQNRGRAILTVLSPVFLWMFLIWITIEVLGYFA